MTDYQDLVLWVAALADILGKGKQKQDAAGSWMSCCPAHDDENPSLKIYADDQVRFKCFAGCEDSAIRAAITSGKYGIREIPTLSRNYNKNSAVSVNKLAHGDRPDDSWMLSVWQKLPDALYTYRNAKGQAVFFVARFNPVAQGERKTFKQVCSARPKAGGDPFWIGQAYPAPRPLYNLPELTQRSNAPVLIVEGEKAADAAKLLLPGYVVVSWAGGSSTVPKNDWSVLQGRDVTLWPDNDEPGIKAMSEIAGMLSKGRKAAKSVKLVFNETNDNFPVGFDLADPYEDSYTPLPYILDNAPDVDPSKYLDAPLPADEEEVAERLRNFLDKYVALTVGPDHQYVDITSGSPFVGDMIPYARHTKFTLEQRELDTFLDVSTKTPKKKKFIDVFLESNKKTWVHGIVYDPSTMMRLLPFGDKFRLNLYCGLAFPPQPCEHTKYQCFIDHIYKSCQTKEEADYLLDWFAAKIQNPDQMVGTMVILSGRQGCGKTIVCDIIRTIMGRHNAVKIGMSDLSGSFNSQYANKLFIDVEEYNPGQSKILRELREKVKNLVTSESMIVNTKGLPAYENPAYHSIIATTNSQEPEDISFDNRRMTFMQFDNLTLQMQGRVIDDVEYFKPLYELKKSPEALSGLCHYLMQRTVNMNRVTKPFNTPMTEEALTFVDTPVFAFMRSLADAGVLPGLDALPDKENPFPIRQWPQQAVAMPRQTLSYMYMDYCEKFRRETITMGKASKDLLRMLMRRGQRKVEYQYPRGIPESYEIDKLKRWSMMDKQGTSYELRDRAICLPDIDELRAMLDVVAGAPIDWSAISPADDPGANVVVEFPGKKEDDDMPSF